MIRKYVTLYATDLIHVQHRQYTDTAYDYIAITSKHPSTIHFLNMELILNSLLASSDFCHLLIIFANSVDPDQDQENFKINCFLKKKSLKNAIRVHMV